jgi:chromosome transmission fidelity protein 1
MKICGYFSSRRAMLEADVIVTPYQSILSETTRESLGISLTSKAYLNQLTLCNIDKVLVFDEGHNIMETICSLNSVSITYSQMHHGSSQLSEYIKKYVARLAPKNLKSLKDIISVMSQFIKYVNKQCDSAENGKDGEKTIVLEVIDILTELDLYKVDF